MSAVPPPHDKPPLIPFSGQGAKLALIIGLAAAVVSACCCLGAGLGVVVWGRDMYRMVLNNLPGAELGEPARDERISFTVHGFQCGVGRLGGFFASQLAIGQFCIVEISAHNVGDRGVTVSDAAQRAVLASGRKCVADTTAGLLANAEQRIFPSVVVPGQALTGLIVFDIPVGAEINRLELHETSASDGVRVRLR